MQQISGLMRPQSICLDLFPPTFSLLPLFPVIAELLDRKIEATTWMADHKMVLVLGLLIQFTVVGVDAS